eukprot:CAMPEP_0206545566 /NCGR_PEP_ID=MMETSP0325_2-20121206/12211_1 /ASSEMBLY_ACC=CAM_ASM_000347 /TAXON_ID=2866 /ORGANISM="Crypthecodinium cohnii, Strain Seligo" /LENGTH=56 /DNA_ID=CAMNT_0054044573 /DNA_START=121 /DNA_END=288 /DNA_ORIENTATION=-
MPWNVEESSNGSGAKYHKRVVFIGAEEEKKETEGNDIKIELQGRQHWEAGQTIQKD